MFTWIAIKSVDITRRKGTLTETKTIILRPIKQVNVVTSFERVCRIFTPSKPKMKLCVGRTLMNVGGWLAAESAGVIAVEEVKSVLKRTRNRSTDI